MSFPSGMVLRHDVLSVCFAFLLSIAWMMTVFAKDLAPSFGATGRGHYDQYIRTILCNAVLEAEQAAGVADGQDSRLAKGVDYTLNFARFLLESGNVVDGNGIIRTTDILEGDLRAGHDYWHAQAQAPRSPGDMVARCVAEFGHDWE